MAFSSTGELTVTITDAEGETATTKFNIAFDPIQTWTDLSADLDVIAGYVQSLTNGLLRQWSWGVKSFKTSLVPSATGKYPNAEDKLEIQMRGLDGSVVQWKIPAPKDTVFEDDLETCAPSVVPLSTFISAVETPLTTCEIVTTRGAVISTFDFGYRSRAASRCEKPGRASAIG